MAGAPTVGSIFKETIVVGVGEYAVARNSNAILTTYALGSCIGLVLHDSTRSLGGMLHFMLPESKLNPQKAAAQPSIFADTGIPLLVKVLNGFGSKISNIRAFVAGGANMSISCDCFKIGERNTQSVQMILRDMGIPLLHCITGNIHNRTMFFHLQTGIVELRANNDMQTYHLS